MTDDMSTDTTTVATDRECVEIEGKARATKVMHWPELVRVFNRLRRAEEKLQRIKQWCDAYPLEVFPEPDFKEAQRLLKAGGMTIDAISASNMRHVLDGIRKITDGETE
jgi:hypothetical protein